MLDVDNSHKPETGMYLETGHVTTLNSLVAGGLSFARVSVEGSVWSSNYANYH